MVYSVTPPGDGINFFRGVFMKKYQITISDKDGKNLMTFKVEAESAVSARNGITYSEEFLRGKTIVVKPAAKDEFFVKVYCNENPDRYAIYTEMVVYAYHYSEARALAYERLFNYEDFYFANEGLKPEDIKKLYRLELKRREVFIK